VAYRIQLRLGRNDQSGLRPGRGRSAHSESDHRRALVPREAAIFLVWNGRVLHRRSDLLQPTHRPHPAVAAPVDRSAEYRAPLSLPAADGDLWRDEARRGPEGRV